MKLTLTYVKNEDRVSKKGKPYVSCSLRAIEFGETYINGFGNYETKQWQIGDMIDVEVYDEEYQGKTYKKFKVPNQFDKIEKRLTKLENYIYAGKPVAEIDPQAPPEVPDDLPF